MTAPDPLEGFAARLADAREEAEERAVSGEMSGLGRELTPLGESPVAPLHWSVGVDEVIYGHASGGDYDEATALRVVHRWADLLGLIEQAAATPGTTEFAGDVGGQTVAVWCVTDREVFEGRRG